MRILAALKKYGRRNFIRETLGIYETWEEMNAAEIALITPEALADPACYNITKGGQGSYTKRTQQRRPMIVTIISKEGDEISGSVVEISKKIGVPTKKIYDLIHGHRRVYRGFTIAGSSPTACQE
ncbi:hypothetical protein [Paracoccus sulfuroxidans]|uniref:Uncharacterized protein n=1 Tax=Paracoccus sulfuroxidans TaxID=384678 RepID=A0A562P1D0_9RHOB|nr:hypothetical protein [Paracoccus sulfuroxidans]TWI38245.1 hypothetical protein IQ24_00383 [Paracoccus sulfuroxidans]